MQVLTHTFTGRVIDLENFTKDDVDLTDIAISLSRQRRYAGHTAVPYSVGMHLIACVSIADALKMSDDICELTFLHDIEETWVQDVVSPIKHNYMLARFRQLSDEITAVVHDFFKVTHKITPEKLDVVSSIDKVAYHFEARKMIPSYRFEEKRWTPDQIKMIKELEGMSFAITDDLLVNTDTQIAQIIFEMLNVLHVENVHGVKLSAEK